MTRLWLRFNRMLESKAVPAWALPAIAAAGALAVGMLLFLEEARRDGVSAWEPFLLVAVLSYVPAAVLAVGAGALQGLRWGRLVSYSLRLSAFLFGWMLFGVVILFAVKFHSRDLPADGEPTFAPGTEIVWRHVPAPGRFARCHRLDVRGAESSMGA